MANKIVNIEDTLYILNARIQILQDILALDVSPDLFLDKSIDDMDFIDKTLAVLIKILTEDPHIAEREEQLDNLSEIEWQFSQVLALFLNSSSTISVEQFPILRDTILALRNQSAVRRKVADDSTSKKEGVETIPIVSSDEMSELIKKL
ncbi:MAG: hypothetical protein LBP19_06240 [Treponema sp.]|nr:hypothetical protein [Treponema sp.]